MTRWRSILFLPATRPDLAAKAARCAPDAVVLDLEDAVPAAQKDEARTKLAEGAAALTEASTSIDVLVRVNPPATEWFTADLAALPEHLAGVVVPKYEKPIDLGLPVIAGIETVRGVLDARDTLPTATACYFGAEDYIADLGGVRTSGNAEVAVPRATVAQAARLAGIPAYDMVTIDVRDLDRFRAEAQQARALGYAGKLCIHPDQVTAATEAFTPTDDERAWATKILEAFDAAAGATIAVDGQMVDEVVARQARAILGTS